MAPGCSQTVTHRPGRVAQSPGPAVSIEAQRGRDPVGDFVKLGPGSGLALPGWGACHTPTLPLACDASLQALSLVQPKAAEPTEGKGGRFSGNSFSALVHSVSIFLRQASSETLHPKVPHPSPPYQLTGNQQSAKTQDLSLDVHTKCTQTQSDFCPFSVPLRLGHGEGSSAFLMRRGEDR